MTGEINKQLDKDNHLFSEKSYISNIIVILGISIFFLMLRYGAIVPDLDDMSVKGFKIINLSKTIAAAYLVWLYLYLNFYQKYWHVIEKEIARSKENIFKEKIAYKILRKTHEKLGHDFDYFNINSIHKSPKFQFSISYSPVTFEEYGEDKDHGSRFWVIDLKLKHYRKYLLPYLAEVYFRSPILTAYIIPFAFPIVVFFICMIGDWGGSLTTIFSAFSGKINS